MDGVRTFTIIGKSSMNVTCGDKIYKTRMDLQRKRSKGCLSGIESRSVGTRSKAVMSKMQLPHTKMHYMVREKLKPN